ncbi:MAG: T9SS type A sorting domain-containing protein [Ignavibacteriae bacterium]|nr:T9SS type A sorting domain-containing protein [Ignavibacteriota bacterium]
MKHLILFVVAILLSTTAVAQGNRIAVSFVTVNAYGNNLYLDNFSVGSQFDTDIGVAAIRNINKDTSYVIGNANYRIAPTVAFVNVGRTDITTPFDVTFTTIGGTSSTKQIASLAKGAIADVQFDSLLITVSTGMNFRIYSSLAADQNRMNDTLNQYSMFLPGVRRNILLEEWTSSTCAPCAANNPSVDDFIAQHFNLIVPVKYHVGWPSPGNDPMYLFNTTQSYDRRYYYGVNSVPHVIFDGVVDPSYPYSTPTSLPNARDARINIGAPLTVTVTDTRVGDSIRANVVVNVVSQLRAGTYKLRVQGIERHIAYTTPPGTNGESHFHDVFRGAFPNSTGSAIPLTADSTSFTFTYKINSPAIMDSMYTIAFVQNDVTREVMNCGKSLHAFSLQPAAGVVVAPEVGPKDVCIAPTEQLVSGPVTASNSDAPQLTGAFDYELFEGTFPPSGWKLVNPNADITFSAFGTANGVSFGGTSSVKMDFYNYSTTGRIDSLKTRVFTGLLPTDSVKFDWSYAPYTGSGYNDRLIVKVSTNGGATFDSTIFDRSGAALGTAPASANEFTPSSPSQWRTFAYPLRNLVTAVNDNVSHPTSFSLSQNYPNPFNPTTTIKFTIPVGTGVAPSVLKVFDVLGSEVATLVNEWKEAGTHQVHFDASRLASGMYFYRITAGSFVATKKMMVVK